MEDDRASIAARLLAKVVGVDSSNVLVARPIQDGVSEAGLVVFYLPKGAEVELALLRYVVHAVDDPLHEGCVDGIAYFGPDTKGDSLERIVHHITRHVEGRPQETSESRAN